jgi:AcrR family transcriptional regulator
MASPLDQPTRTDRRSQKTRLALRNALLQMLGESTWEEIDVQALCDHANVGRSTFYEHYPNKEQLLCENFSEIGAIFARAGTAAAADPAVALHFVDPMIEHMHEAKSAFRSLLGRRANYFPRQQFQAMLVELISNELDALSAAPEWHAEALAQAIGGAMFGTIHWWIDGNRPHSAKEISLFLHRLAHAMLAETRVVY